MPWLREIWANRWVKLVVALLGIAIFGYFLHGIRSILTALAVAWVLAYICDPAVDWLERRRFSRTMSVAVLAAFLIVAAVVVVLVMVPVAVLELRDLGRNMPNYGELLSSRWVPAVESALGFKLPSSSDEIRQFFQAHSASVNQIAEALRSPLTDFAKSTLSGVASFITGLLTLIVIPVAWFFLVRDIDRINVGALALIPTRFRAGASGFAKEVDEIVSNFLRGQIVVAAILACLYSLGLWLVADVPLGLIIGLFAGAAAIVPYLGVVLGVVPALVLAFLQHQDLKHPLLVIAVFAVAQALEGNLITPKVVGDKVGLHPVTVIFALLIWAQLAGILGMLIAIPATAVLQVLLLRWVKHYQAGEFFNGGAR